VAKLRKMDMRALNVNEIEIISGGEISPDEGAALELAVAGVALAASGPALALIAIGAAAISYALD
jgi:hypothetical protein